MAPNHDGVTALFRLFRWQSMAGRCSVQINSRTGDSVFAIVSVFFVYIKITFLAEQRHELVAGCVVSRYEQFDTSPETVEQELLPAV